MRRRALTAGLLAWTALPLRHGLAAAPGAAAHAPLLSGLDGPTFPIDSALPLVRRLVHQGTMLVTGFNPGEAVRSLEAAVALDPACATAWWALAWALGPNINTDMAPGAEPRVLEALAQARRHAGRAAPLQRELIAALSARHPGAGAIDEEAYARQMGALQRRHPRSARAAVLAAEAQLNLYPYDWWTPEGRPQPWTPRIEALLLRAMALQPRAPDAHHYWIHLQESSPQPQRAAASADFLRHAVPGSGHLLHMPAHIDMRSGRYAAATAASQRSIEADERYLAQVDAQGAYRVGYVAHNHHFLWAAAAMQGRSQTAIAATQAAWPAACGPRPGDLGSGTLQHYAVLPLHALVRFGRWQDLLTGTRPPDGKAAYLLAMWHYARGTAWSRSGRPQQARGALAALQSAAAEPELQTTKVKNVNPAADLVRIASLTLQADLAAADGRHGEAVALLQQAVDTEDALAADEPHLWLAPTRLALGAALLEAGQATAAERVFRQDLRHYPENGWSLAGLAQALHRQRRKGDATAVEARFQAAWRDADIALKGPRF